MRTRPIIAALLLAAALAGCSRPRDPNALSPDDSRQLDNAAHMLDTPADNSSTADEQALGNDTEAPTNEADNGQ